MAGRTAAHGPTGRPLRRHSARLDRFPPLAAADGGHPPPVRGHRPRRAPAHRSAGARRQRAPAAGHGWYAATSGVERRQRAPGRLTKPRPTSIRSWCWPSGRFSRAAPRCWYSASTSPAGTTATARSAAGNRTSPSSRRARIGGSSAAAARPVGISGAHLPVLRERRSDAHHLVCDARRPLSRVRLRRLPALSEGVRREERDAAGDGRRRHHRHAAARCGGDAARLRSG